MAIRFLQHDIEEGAPIIEEGVLPGISENEPAPSNNNGAQADHNHKEDVFHENGESHKDHHHGHAAKQPSYVSQIASSVVCFVIYFVFCIVFSSVVWDPLQSSRDPNINPPYGVAQGVGINLMGIAVGSVFFAWKSGCKAIIAGPDLLPIVFFAEAGASVYAYLAKASAETLRMNCENGVVDDAHRFLGGGGYAADVSADPCDLFHRHLAGEEVYLDEDSISKVVPTTLVVMMIGNLVTALVFYGLGKAKNTASVIGCIPASVVAGFLTCIGYKVCIIFALLILLQILAYVILLTDPNCDSNHQRNRSLN